MLIRIYAPTLVSDETAKFSYYKVLQDLLQSIPRTDKIILFGDFNARFGSDWETLSYLGRYRTDKMDSKSQLLLELCIEY